ncbi:stalk domain-containing protein [Tumebacillus sp. DT12]|uniref:Stalk domain-containing protein n=1 Tax=Tumebacillus lacus TaxID=2995335 RepID=A0ABT3WVQ9_9BACL|nr:stalk domain-containing protein [Tumebacillus lacus]MCX7568719.1 stalk domain-containing protein [Tumebacillus lacus]
MKVVYSFLVVAIKGSVHMFKNAKGLIAGIIIGAVVAGTGVAAADQTVNAYLSSFKFKFNGVEKQLPEGYTVLNYQNRSYVPARFVAESMGGNVEFDVATGTVNIHANSNEQNKQEIKDLVGIADVYRRLGDLEDHLDELNSSLSLAWTGVEYRYTTEGLDLSKKRHEFTTKVMMDFATYTDSYFSTIGGESNPHYKAIEPIYKKYLDSLIALDESIKGLRAYYDTRNQTSYDYYMRNREKALDLYSAADQETAFHYNGILQLIRNK